MPDKANSITVNGRVTNQQNEPLPGLAVRAHVRAVPREERPIGEPTVTDADGRYQLTVTLDEETRVRPLATGQVFVRVFDGDWALGDSEARAVPGPSVVLDVRLDYGRDNPKDPWMRVQGTVRDQYGDPLTEVTVRAFDRDLRSEQMLGETKVRKGRYMIRYRRSQFQSAEKDAADLVMKVVNPQGVELYKSSIRFNAPSDLLWDIGLQGATYEGPSEWETLTSTITPLLDKVTPTQLREDDQFQDVTFLEGETGTDWLIIGTWSACFHLAEKTAREQTPIAPEAFFGFLRQGQPSIFSETLLEDMQHPDRLALLEDSILRRLSALTPDLQRSLLEKAITDRLIPRRISATIDQILEILRLVKLRYAAETTIGGGKGTVGELLSLNPEAKEREIDFLAALSTHTGSLDTFWTKLEEEEVLPPAVLPKVKLTFEVGALTRNHIPLVRELATQFESGQLTAKRDLARLERADWVRTFQRPGPDGKPIGVPANIDGETPEERMEQFATTLERQLERAYPTTAFAAKLARARQRPEQHAASRGFAMARETELGRFFENNPAFQLDRFRIDHYVAENPAALEGIEDKPATVGELKSVQRIFKLNPTYDVVEALHTRGIDSAQQIYFMGQGQFLASMASAPINALEAKRLFRKAESAYAMTLALFADYNVAMNGVAPHAVPPPVGTPQAQAILARPRSFRSRSGVRAFTPLPNLQTLFGSLDYCECTQCRSVYSPSAHFVDVMRFLGQRNTQGSGVNAGRKVRDVLLGRRPDLGEIELSCENTNTVLPYIDLVNEILEEVVALPIPVALNAAIEPDLTAGTVKASVLAELSAKGVSIAADAHVFAPDSRAHRAIRDSRHAYRIYKTGPQLYLVATRQTFLSTAELRANPEYTNSNTYLALRQAVFPHNLPFDLWHLQARTYLAHLGVSHPKLLELFQQETPGATLAPTNAQIDCAWLGITEIDRQILVGPLPGKQSWDFWGLSEAGNNIPNPRTPADAAQNVTGTWIDVLAKVDVMLHRSALSYRELLQVLDMRYVNPGRTIFIIDSAEANAASCDTSKFTIRNLDGAALDRLHRFVRLWRRMGCAMWELDLLLQTPITEAVLQDLSRLRRLQEETKLDWREMYSFHKGIDHNVYVDRGREGAPSVQTLYERLFRNKLVDAVATFPPSPAQLTGTIGDRVPGILAAFRIREVDLDLILDSLGLGTATNLTGVVLGDIYRITALAKSLSLTIDAFLRLERLWGQDPFATPLATREFIDLAGTVARSPFSVLELDYLLAHRIPVNSGVALDDRAIIGVIEDIRTGMQAIDDDIRLKTEETPEAYVRSKLGLLPALAMDADQQIALALIDGSWAGTAASRTALITSFFTGIFDVTEATAALAEIASGLSAAERQAKVDERFGYAQPALEAFLVRSRKELFVRQKVAQVLQLDVPSASVLLEELHLPGDSATLLETLNDERLVDRLPDGTFELEPTEANFQSIFDSLRLLHKDALMVARLGITLPELRWWIDGSHATAMGWMHPVDFPVDDTTQLPIEQWMAIQRFFDWRQTLPSSGITAVEFAANVLDATKASSTNLAELADLTGWEPTDIATLVAAFRWLDAGNGVDTVKQELRKSVNLVRLADAMRALRRLGVNADRAVQWAKAEPTEADAESLKQTVKAKYDLPQWQQVIQPMQDEFREQKRHALVQWLVAHPDQTRRQFWSDADGLYSHFLIDVEMSACALTSRLKQATASVQLFVQRCLLNLEEDILAKTDLDPKWKQWKWMKNYRVWEANRKVFLYPENWIEPELRDEKSPFFKALEQELMQNEITDESAEQAYLNYLEKLDTVANLEIRATYHQDISANESILHVVGRTRSSLAPEHYYRRRINGGRWTAWEKVELDIASNHLVIGVHNRRLYALWPQLLVKADEPTSVATPSANSSATLQLPHRHWEVRLFWSELKKGKWTPKVLSDSFATVFHGWTGGNRPENIEFRTRLAPQIQTRLYLSTNPAAYAPKSDTLFDKNGKHLTVETAPTYEHLISPAESQYHNNLILHTTTSQYFYYNVVEELQNYGQHAHQNAVAIRLLQQITPGRTFSVIDSKAKAFAGDGTFFVWDSARSYFVSYVWSSDTSYVSRQWRTITTAAFRFYIHYHPFVELFIKELNIWGIRGLLNRRIQVDPASIPGSPTPFNFADYKPDVTVVPPFPVENVDFSYMGPYSPYNWELFFHAPFLIANKLATNQRFEEALRWYHYIFDPTSTDTTTADPDTPQQKYWITKPFYETTRAEYYQQKIESIMLGIAKGDAALRAQVNEWRDNPFNPHLIARMRTAAYQKNVVVKYIQTLIAWGDQLFRQDTIESLNEATQLYILAGSILGQRPTAIPRKVANPVKTFYQLGQEGIDDFGNVLKEVENLLPDIPTFGTGSDDAPELPRLDVLYFCIPNNDKLLTLWDTVADRLFKIRHCMNIQGVVRQLPLFEPPIDPAALVKAAAAGVDIGSMLADMSAPLPLYRFTVMIQRATELCQELRALGAAMLSALEKRDAEGLTRLRSSQELLMLDKVRAVRVQQVDEATKSVEALKASCRAAEHRRKYYTKLAADGLNAGEITAVTLSSLSVGLEATVAAGYIVSSGLKLIPDFLGGVSGFGGTPTVNMTMGGRQVGNGAEMAVRTLQSIATAFDKGANLASVLAGFARRGAEWEYQKGLAQLEIEQLDKQTAVAEVRATIATKELANHDALKQDRDAEDEYMRTKFTNEELHDWTVNQLSTLYFQSYQLAYDVAKRAERCFRYELGLSDSGYVQFGYWDGLKKGLLAGERMSYDLKRLEAAYYEQNRREYELMKHVSLAQLDPAALLKLRQNGECFLDVPETAFDMDYPGQYFRRLRSVGLSIPCTVGPLATVGCTLTLTSNRLRTDSTLVGGKYMRDLENDDPRFRDEIAAIQSIAASTGVNDRGLFELNFRDDRYLPFEGAGAISSWHIKLNKDLPQFDFATISDVVLHVDYTAREGGELLRSKVVEEFSKKLNDMVLAENRKGLFRVFDLKREYPDGWYRFLHPANPADDQALVLDALPERLPFFARSFTSKKARQVEVVALMNDEDADYEVMLSPLGSGTDDLLLLQPDPAYEGMHRAPIDLTGNEIELGAWTVKVRAEGAADFRSLPPDAIKELFLITNYTVA